jgi:very-short-patch-repair endonuclease
VVRDRRGWFIKELIPQRFLDFSKRLRTNQTPWEWNLWKKLRAGRFYGLKFKRQVLLDNYIVDFYCHSIKLVIELDGGHHNEDIRQKLDIQRQKVLENSGYIVLRFWNSEIEQNLDGVLDKIKDVAKV